MPSYQWEHMTLTTYYSRMALEADAVSPGGWELVAALPKGAERVVLLFKRKSTRRVYKH